MEELISKSLVVCLPTTYGEGIPKILLEAAACGRPIIATDVPGCREIVMDKENGFLINPGDTQELQNKIIELAKDYELCEKMGRKGREVVEEKFLIEKINAETLAVYDSV